MDPRDAAEARYAGSDGGYHHQAVMMLGTRLNRAPTFEQQGAAERSFNKTARTFAAQMDTLKRYRSKG